MAAAVTKHENPHFSCTFPNATKQTKNDFNRRSNKNKHNCFLWLKMSPSSGKCWIWLRKIAFQVEKFVFFLTLSLKDSTICFENLSSKKKKGKLLGRKHTPSSLAVQKRPPSKKSSGKGASPRAPTSMTGKDSWLWLWFPSSLQLLKFLCSSAVRRMKAKLPLGSHCQHPPQTMA